MTLTPTGSPAEQRDALTTRLFGATLGAFDLLSAMLGLELGYYRALADGGPATAGELATRTRTDRRYTREWLEQQAVTGILEVDDTGEPETRRYTLPAGHALALLDPDDLATASPMPRFVLSGARMLPLIADAYRTGAGIDWADYPGLIEAQELANRPMFRHLLAQEWLPAIPDVHARLQAGARVADLGAGAGWSSIAIAKAYPNAHVDGLDLDAQSVERARANAAAEGADPSRLRFHHVDAGDHRLDGRYDLVTIIEALHDLSQPVAVLTAAGQLLAPGGTVLVVDEKVAETFTAPGDEIERLMYGYSILYCLVNARVDPHAVGTGTVMRPATVRAYAEAAGFSRVTVLPIEHEVFRFYRLDP